MHKSSSNLSIGQYKFMANLRLQSHGGGYILSTVQKFACGLDRDSSDWEPAQPQSIFVQSDYDFPFLASLLGFTPCSECQLTDGTVDCEHNTANEMVSTAADFLSKKTGILSGKKYAYAYKTVMSDGQWG